MWTNACGWEHVDWSMLMGQKQLSSTAMYNILLKEGQEIARRVSAESFDTFIR